jgi:hypothetical protein
MGTTQGIGRWAHPKCVWVLLKRWKIVPTTHGDLLKGNALVSYASFRFWQCASLIQI